MARREVTGRAGCDRTGELRAKTSRLVAHYRLSTISWSKDVSASGVATCLPNASPRVNGAASSGLSFLQPQKLRLPVTAHTPGKSHPTRQHGRIYMWANWAARNGIKFNTNDGSRESICERDACCTNYCRLFSPFDQLASSIYY